MKFSKTRKQFSHTALNFQLPQKRKEHKNIRQLRQNFFKDKKISFYKLPQKSYIEDESFDNGEYLIESSYPKKDNYIFKINYQNTYESISEFYYPIINTLSSEENFNQRIHNIIYRIQSYLSKNVAILSEKKDNAMTFKTTEMKIIIYLLYYIQIANDLYFNFCLPISEQQRQNIFNLIKLALMMFYKNIILIIYLNVNHNKKQQTQRQNIGNFSFEELCMKYVKGLINIENDMNEREIIDSIQQGCFLLSKCLTSLNNLILVCINDSIKEIPSFILKNLLLEEISNFDLIKGDISYDRLFKIVLHMLKVYDYLNTKDQITIPYLPSMSSKCKYTLVLDLDDTLVNIEKKDINGSVHIRPYIDFFLNKLSEFYEIVLFTASVEEYADLMIQRIDKDKAISYVLNRKHLTILDDVTVKDLTKLGRDLKRIVIVDNDEDNFILQKENGLQISSYNGNERDMELFILAGELVEIAKSNADDIRPLLCEIRAKMEKRYSFIN